MSVCSALMMMSMLGTGVLAPAPASQVGARAVVDTAIARMGGETALRAVHRARYDMMTQWLSTTFDARPFQNAPGYEWHTDYRDYDSRTWRNVRRFMSNGAWAATTDLVVDTVAARTSGPYARGVATPAGDVDGWAPLDVAYVDERRELFLLTPERILLLAHDAPDLRQLGDTVIGGIRHAVVAATIDGFPTRVYLRRTDGFLAMARYHADESNDFGLAPWGPMDVAVWYSVWRTDAASHLTLPREWDITRVGVPYKRMTVLGVAFNDTMPADSLVLTDAVRRAYLAHARRPMADLPLDSARIVAAGRLVEFRTPGAPLAGVKLGGGWLLIEPGNLPLNAERADAWLAAHDHAHVTAGLIGGSAPSGGAAWIARKGMPLYLAPAGEASTGRSLRNYGAPLSTLRHVTNGEWIRTSAGGDSAWVEPIDLPNAPRTLMLYVPSMRWVYSSKISGPAELALVAARARARGWAVDRIGSPANPTGVAPMHSMSAGALVPPPARQLALPRAMTRAHRP